MVRKQRDRKEYIKKYNEENKERIKERSRKYNLAKKKDLSYTIKQKLVAYKGKAKRRKYSFNISITFLP